MKVKPVGEEVYFEAVEIGSIFWFEGFFYYKINTCFDTNNYGVKYNCIEIKNGNFRYVDAREKVCFYPNAAITLV